ncbi:MAG TPA: hypothetical protein VG267_12930 [Terracidiphilus sp.]|nr:hypothetical protein [Terracidiphilus sp.]
MAITLIALVEVVLGFLAPRLFSRLPLNPAVSRRASTPGKQWIVRCVTSMSMFLSCILFALVLHFVGARAYFVELLIAVGMLSLILWRPGTPPGSEDGVITHY